MIHFSVAKDAITPLLTVAQPLCTKRTPMEVTSSLSITIDQREMILKATDLEVSLQAAIQVETQSLLEELSVLVNGKRLFDIVRELSGTLECVIDNGSMSITADSVSVQINLQDAEHFPVLFGTIENIIECKTADLIHLLESVVNVAANNNATQALNGVLLEIGPNGIAATATDGHSLMHCSSDTYTLDTKRAWLLPKKAVIELKKLLEVLADQEVFIGIAGEQVAFSSASFNFFTKVIADQFPAYSSLLTKDGYAHTAVEKEALLKSLRRTTCFLGGTFVPTTFIFDSKSIDIAIQNNNIGKLAESIPAASGNITEPIQMLLYSPYVITAINSLHNATVSLHVLSKNRPLIIHENHDGFAKTCVIMPVAHTS